MPITLVTAPNSEPLTVAEAKEHLRVDWSEDDEYIGSLITACRRLATAWTNKSFVNEKWDERFETWPKGKSEMTLQRAPLSTVSSVTYIDTNGATQTWASTNYTVVTGQRPGKIALKWAGSWPVGTLQPGLPIKVRYTAGFGTSADSVPEEDKLLLKALVAHFYAQREPVITGTIAAKVPYHLEALLMANTVWV